MTECIVTPRLNPDDTGREGFFFHPSWPIFYEDNHLLVLYKPSGLLTQGDISKEPNLFDLVKRWIKIKYSKSGNVFVGLVHRLDRLASGVIVFTKTSKAAGRLTEQFKNHLVEKIYLVVVEGIVERRSDVLIHNVKPGRLRTVVVPKDDPDAQKAELWYEVLDRSIKEKKTFMKIKLLTGRKHQIRAQMSFIKHPVLGDTLYGSTVKLRSGAIALHAHEIIFEHPTRKVPIPITSPVPASWPWKKKVSIDKNLFWTWEEIKESFLPLLVEADQGPAPTQNFK
ncbi:MAG: RNA pseudouridine synthase [Syntrophobacterales bacterium]|nr:RNA pseudouridine synthase [Syntrophobacterales bacterium]